VLITLRIILLRGHLSNYKLNEGESLPIYNKFNENIKFQAEDIYFLVNKLSDDNETIF
jgi:hypothetical protein